MLFDAIRQEIFDQIQAALAHPDELELVLETPPDPRMGDFAFPTFRLAKTLRKAPPLIAKELAEKLGQAASLSKICDVSVAGPYVNFSVKQQTLLTDVLGSILLSGDKLAEKSVKKPETVILEFSSPNVAKAFNIYHLRSTMIGNCLNRVFRARGFNAVAINHLGDWGTQYGTLALAYDKWGDENELERRGIEYLVELYVRINKEIEQNSDLEGRAREYFAKLERGDLEIKKVWEKFVALSLKEFNRTYARLNVTFDHFWGESFYVDKVPALERLLEEKKLLIESQGAHVVDLEKHAMPPCIIRKQDGSTIYATRDLAAAIYRQDKFRFSKCVYVVGGEQKLHFAQVFKVLELMGYPWAKDCIHVDFGLYRFKDAKMSTRKGNFITMEAVLDQAVDRVKQVMAEKNTTMPSEERDRCAEIIGVGAIVYNDLSTDRNTDVNFDLDRVLDFEGETGPYIQYAHTRCLGILRNAPLELTTGLSVPELLDLAVAQPGLQTLAQAAVKKLSHVEELDLIRVLAKLPLVLDSVVETYRPSHLATYLIEITKAFNTFYRAHKVLVEDMELARARLALVLATQRTLLRALSLLGMRVPERM
ncbi:MAG: arginine--tRNA ligase [Bdellovibrionota bacterium]